MRGVVPEDLVPSKLRRMVRYCDSDDWNELREVYPQSIGR